MLKALRSLRAACERGSFGAACGKRFFASAPRPPFRRRVLFETLEPRILLSADFLPLTPDVSPGPLADYYAAEQVELLVSENTPPPVIVLSDEPLPVSSAQPSNVEEEELTAGFTVGTDEVLDGGGLTAAALEPSFGPDALLTTTWDGGGGDSQWSNPLNWDRDQLPTAEYQVVIGGTGGTIVYSAGITTTVGALVITYTASDDRRTAAPMIRFTRFASIASS